MRSLFGDNPFAVILKLAIASIVIGLILSVFGFNPYNLYDALGRLAHWISTLGVDAVEKVFHYLLLGAIVVVPLWLLSRFLSVLGGKSKPEN